MPTRIEPNVSREALFEKLSYEPHSPEQWAAHRATERFRSMCCGRRWGKSVWAGHELTRKMFVPESINWNVGPNYVHGEKEFRVVWNDFKKLGLLKRCKTHYSRLQGNMSIYFPDLESLLEVKSADRPDTLVGEGIHHVHMAEAAKHKRNTWEMYIRPALQDVRGTADFSSTPQGFNWFKGLFDLGQDPTESQFMSMRHPSWENTALFPGGREDPEILDIERQVSKVFFEQEIAALFTTFEGQIYPEFDESAHVREFEYRPEWKNWWTLDFGYVDPFVCLDIMIDPSDRVWVWREYVESYRATNEHGGILKERESPEGFHVDAIAADPRGADEIATLVWYLGSIEANSVGRALGYEEVKKALKIRDDGMPGLIIHPRCVETIRQVRDLRAKSDHNGTITQIDGDDHTADALRYFFNEYFVLGANHSLTDLYDTPYRGSEAAGFFTYHKGLNLREII